MVARRERTCANIRPNACHNDSDNVVIWYICHDVSIATCFLGGGGVVVAKKSWHYTHLIGLNYYTYNCHTESEI